MVEDAGSVERPTVVSMRICKFIGDYIARLIVEINNERIEEKIKFNVTQIFLKTKSFCKRNNNIVNVYRNERREINI